MEKNVKVVKVVHFFTEITATQKWSCQFGSADAKQAIRIATADNNYKGNLKCQRLSAGNNNHRL